VQAFGNVKNEIPSVSRYEPACQRFYIANPVSLKAVVYNYLLNSFNCIGEIKFSCFFETKSFFQVIIA
jgi:hypothetical protein